MSKKKSIALIVIMSIVVAVLTVLSFVKFYVPGYKNGTTYFEPILGRIVLDQDLSDGVAYDLTLKDKFDEVAEDIDDKDVIKTLKARLDALGYENAVVNSFRASETENYSFHIEMRDTETVESDIEVVAKYGELSFYDGEDNEIITGDEGMKSAKYIAQKAGATYTYMVEVTFTDEGYDAITSAISSAESEFTLKIKVGSSEVFSDTITADSIANKTVYITSSSKDTAEQLALQLSSGGLKYEYEVSEKYTVTPTLGIDIAKAIVWVVAITIILLAIGLVVLYRGLGLLTAITVYVLVLFELLMLVIVPGIIVNLGGVLGVIASIVITVGLLINLVNKIQTEAKSGKTVKAAIKAGYSKTLAMNLEVCGVIAVLSLITLLICNGYIKCFAIALGIGSVLCALAVVLFSRLLISVTLPLLKDKSEKFLNIKKGAN